MHSLSCLGVLTSLSFHHPLVLWLSPFMYTGPISSGLGEAESTASFPDYAIGAVVGGLVGAAALAVIVLVILAVVYQKRRRISRTIYITTGKTSTKEEHESD